MSNIKKFFVGLKYPFKGFSFIFLYPELSKIVVVQLLLNIITFIIIFSSSFYIFVRWLNALFSYGVHWYNHFFYYFALILGIAVVLIISVLFSGILSGLLGGGLNSRLSEKTEEIYKKMNKRVEIGFVEGLIRDLSYELKNLLLIIFIFVLLIIINLLPVIGTILFTIITFFYSLYAITFKYLDYVMESRKFGFRKKIATVWKSDPFFMGFGLSALLLFLIPIVNFLAHATCIIGGTILYIDEIEK